MIQFLRDIFISESRSLESGVALSDIIDWDSFFGVSTASGAGVAVSEEKAMRIATVYACVRIISESIASLPLMLYKRTDIGKEVDRRNPLFRLIHDEPNELYSAFSFLETITYNVCLRGNGYARIHWRVNRAIPDRFELLHPHDVKPRLNEETGKLLYEVKGELIPSADMLHFKGISSNGIEGLSPLEATAVEVFGTSLAAEMFASNFYKNGANTSGVLEHPAKLKGDQVDRLRKQFAEKYAGVHNAHKPIVLEEGMAYKAVGLSPAEAQLLDVRKYQTTEICRIFRIPPHMVADLDRSTNNNIEQQSLEFVMHTLRPYLVSFEQEFRRKLCSGNRFVEFNLNGLLRGSAKDRAELYRAMFSVGAMSPNEIRRLENLNDYEGGEEYFTQGANVPIKLAGQAFTKDNSNGA